jgi:hypothetical protein
MSGNATHTLWLREDTLLNTSSDSLVEQGIELVVGNGELVVGFHVFLQRDTAGRSQLDVNRHVVVWTRTWSRCAADMLVEFLS